MCVNWNGWSKVLNDVAYITLFGKKFSPHFKP